MKLTVLITTAVILGLAIIPSVFDPEASAVYNACSESRSVINGDAEDRCAKLQDATNTEFLCDGFEPEAHCWVEKK